LNSNFTPLNITFLFVTIIIPSMTSPSNNHNKQIEKHETYKWGWLKFLVWKMHKEKLSRMLSYTKPYVCIHEKVQYFCRSFLTIRRLHAFPSPMQCHSPLLKRPRQLQHSHKKLIASSERTNSVTEYSMVSETEWYKKWNIIKLLYNWLDIFRWNI
jgi:hypothetical protein